MTSIEPSRARPGGPRGRSDPLRRRPHRSWSRSAETLLPALARVVFAGDPQRELRLEYGQIREIKVLLRRRLAEGRRPAGVVGFADNLNVRLAAQEAGMEEVYYPAADAILTYSAYARGCESLIGAYNSLDLAPKGRDEDEVAYTMAWVRHHDRYES